MTDQSQLFLVATSITSSDRIGTTLQTCSLVWKSTGSRQGDRDLPSISSRPPHPAHPGQGAWFRGRCHAKGSAEPLLGPLLLAGPAQRTQGPIPFRDHRHAAPGLCLLPGHPAAAAASCPAPPAPWLRELPEPAWDPKSMPTSEPGQSLAGRREV